MRRWVLGIGGAWVLGLGLAWAGPPEVEAPGLPPRFMPADAVPVAAGPSSSPGPVGDAGAPAETPPTLEAAFEALKAPLAAPAADAAPAPAPTAADSAPDGTGETTSETPEGAEDHDDMDGALDAQALDAHGERAPSTTEFTLGEGPPPANAAGVVTALTVGDGVASEWLRRGLAELQRWQATRGALARLATGLFRAVVAHADPAWIAEWHPTAAVGVVTNGRLLFAAHMTDTPGIHMRHPELAFALPEVIEHLRAAGNAVRKKHPGGMDLQIGDISVRKGGKLKPHFTHQNGRDVDLRYYLLDVAPGDHTHHFVGPDKLDAKRLWTFIDTLVARDAVHLIYMDYRLQKALYDYAIRHLKRTPAELYRVMSWPKAKRRTDAVIQHAKNHFSHMHIMFKSPVSDFWGGLYTVEEASDLQRRVDLATRGSFEHTIAKGETLGHVAKKHKVSIEELMRTNRLTEKSKLRPGQVINVPVQGARRVR